MSDENVKRLYEIMDEVRKEQAQQNERLARIETKLDSNASRCMDRGGWMAGIDKKVDQLEASANSIGGAKGLLAIFISILAAVGAWVQK